MRRDVSYKYLLVLIIATISIPYCLLGCTQQNSQQEAVPSNLPIVLAPTQIPTPIKLTKILTGVDDVVIQNGLAYVASNDGFRILDITNPRTPKEVGFYPTNWHPTDWQWESIALIETRVYIAEIINDTEGIIHVLSVSDPKQIAEIYTYKTQPAPENMLIDGKYLYVLLGTKKMGLPPQDLEIFDISDPVAMNSIKRYQGVVSPLAPLPLTHTAMVMLDGYLYIMGQKLAIVNTADISHEPLTFDTGCEYPGGVSASNGVLYFSCDKHVNHQFHLLDISNQLAILAIQSFTLEIDDSRATASAVMNISGKHLFIGYGASAVAKLLEFDISNAKNPVKVASYGSIAFPIHVSES
jgi:hypothetical protein